MSTIESVPKNMSVSIISAKNIYFKIMYFLKKKIKYRKIFSFE